MGCTRSRVTRTTLFRSNIHIPANLPQKHVKDSTFNPKSRRHRISIAHDKPSFARAVKYPILSASKECCALPSYATESMRRPIGGPASGLGTEPHACTYPVITPLDQRPLLRIRFAADIVTCDGFVLLATRCDAICVYSSMLA